MNKRKLMLLAVTLCMVAILAVGGTLAFFTDVTDVKQNVFTIGNVEIELDETFDSENAQLIPGSKTENAINKDVFVKNTGKNDAWVRVIISIPSHLDVLTTPPETDYEKVAAQNILHMNTVAGVEEIWNVSKANLEAKLSDDQKWNVYTFYYNEPLKVGETSKQLLDQVYLDAKVDYDGKNYTYKGNVVDLSDVRILVQAEAIQSDGFQTYAEAFAAFDAQKAGNYTEAIAQFNATQP